MSEITLTAEVRKDVGKRLQALRRTGKVPGIYYGHGEQNIPVALLETELKPLYTTSAARIINLKLDDGSSHMCILRDIQLDPVTERAVHFDLFGLKENEELTIEVPIKLTGGIPKGVREGGILQHILHKLSVSCLPKHIPDHIEINVEELEINRSIHVKDLSVPNVKILESETSTVVAVIPPVIVKEPEPAAVAVPVAEAPAEPEVIGRGKKVEEGAEGEAEDKKKSTDDKKKPADDKKKPADDKKKPADDKKKPADDKKKPEEKKK
jgi:large subunit ribosomal protein L25